MCAPCLAKRQKARLTASLKCSVCEKVRRPADFTEHQLCKVGEEKECTLCAQKRKQSKKDEQLTCVGCCKVRTPEEFGSKQMNKAVKRCKACRQKQ